MSPGINLLDKLERIQGNGATAELIRELAVDLSSSGGGGGRWARSGVSSGMPPTMRADLDDDVTLCIWRELDAASPSSSPPLSGLGGLLLVIVLGSLGVGWGARENEREARAARAKQASNSLANLQIALLRSVGSAFQSHMLPAVESTCSRMINQTSMINRTLFRKG